MEILLQQLLSGIAMGSVYACLACAIVMVFKSTSQFNFSQGEMAMLSAYIAWSLINHGLPYGLAFILTILISFIGGFLIERIIYRPVENQSHATQVIVFLAILIMISGGVKWGFGPELKVFYSPFTYTGFSNKYISLHEMGLVVVVFIMFLMLATFFKFTKLGLTMRAAAVNPASSRLMGINVGIMLAYGWAISASIGATGGILIAPIVMLDPYMMSGVLIYGFASAILGGISSPGGAVAGGILMGILENMAGTYIPYFGTELKLSFALLVIVGVLLLKPNGLFGDVIHKRV